jgi:hypothetical protein
MDLRWRKSSRSGGAGGNGGGGDCVEVAFAATGPLLRDSKTGEHGPVIRAGHAAFAAMIGALKH